MKSINLDEIATYYLLLSKDDNETVKPATKRDILRSDIKTLKEILASQPCKDYLIDNGNYDPETFIDYCEALVNEKGDTV